METTDPSHLPKWLVMEHTEAARPFYEGGANFFTDGYLRYWIVPILSWTAIATLIFFLVAFLNVLIRRQWIEHERMPYPIAQLPLDMTAPGMSFFQNRAMWWGFGIAATIEIINGLNFLYPSVPLIPIREPTADLALWLNNEPWDAIGTTYFHLRLFMIGLCFLLPIDLSFSMAFFYWVRKAQFIGGRGCWVVYDPLLSLPAEPGSWGVPCDYRNGNLGGPETFPGILKRVIGMNTPLDDSQEPVRYRSAVIGIVICLVLLYVISSQAGMSAWVFPHFFGLYMIIAAAVTRIRAELGPPVHNMGASIRKQS